MVFQFCVICVGVEVFWEHILDALVLWPVNLWILLYLGTSHPMGCKTDMVSRVAFVEAEFFLPSGALINGIAVRYYTVC